MPSTFIGMDPFLEHPNIFPVLHDSMVTYPDVSLDLQAVFDRCYETGPYRRRVQYDKLSCVPPLRPDQEQWATSVLMQKGLLRAAGR